MIFHTDSLIGADSPRVSNVCPAPLTVGVIGCGPRGLYCLDALARSLSSSSSRRRIKVFVFEATGQFGNGLVYQRQQPDWLRMNFATRNIDAWDRSQPLISEHCLTLENWLRRMHPTLSDPNKFIPRSIVGAYLSDCFQIVISELRKFADVHLISRSVDSISRRKSRVVVRYGESTECCDEVVITTGHGVAFSESLDENDIRWHKPYPVDVQLSEAVIPAGCRVAMRGFALTTIDAVLSLTEGRGGRLDRENGNCRYRPSGGEPKIIYPFSRSGRPMLAKPNPEKMNLPAELDELWETLRGEMIESSDESFSQSIWPAVLKGARTALQIVGSSKDPEAFFNEWTSKRMAPEEIAEVISRSIEIANGEAFLDEGWALGEAWRSLYPVLADKISYGGLPTSDQLAFRMVAAEMERIAFGPPSENLEWIIALYNYGILNFDCLESPDITVSGGTTYLQTPTGQVSINHCLNTVLVPPGCPRPTSLLGSLCETGEVKVDASQGVVVERDGRAAVGISVLGRATEGWIIGNDTLSRSLHRQPEYWAHKIIQPHRI